MGLFTFIKSLVGSKPKTETPVAEVKTEEVIVVKNEKKDTKPKSTKPKVTKKTETKTTSPKMTVKPKSKK